MCVFNTRSRFGLLLILGASALIHAALFLFDLKNPTAFVAGDRATQRFENVEQLLRASEDGSLANTLVSAGSPGDYIFHGLIYAWQGMPGVIIMMVLLQLIAIGYVYRLGQLIFKSVAPSLLAAALYALLPAGLLHPHVFVSEAIFNPLLIVSLYYGIRYLLRPETSLRDLLLSALAASCAAFIRELYVIYPFLFAAIILLWTRRPDRTVHAIVYVVASLALPLLWASYMLLQTGNFTMGESGHDLGLNIYGRIERMSKLDGIKLTPKQQQLRRLQVSEYLDYIAQNPAAYLRTVRVDGINITLNSGANSLLGRYLAIYEMPENQRYWRKVQDRGGVWALIKTMYAYSPLLFLVNVVLTPLWVAFLGFAAFGAYVVVKSHALPLSVKAALFSLPVYLLITSQAAIAVRWGFRTPFEFILVLLFVAAVWWMYGKRSQE